jgi:hypothetical protein
MRLAAFLIGAALLSGGALAQPAPDAGRDQSQQLDVEPSPPPPSTEAPTQISNGADSRAAEAQLTSARAAPQEPNQVSAEPRNVQPPTPLSRPSEGRTGAVERVAGTDRCDPAVPREKQSDLCRKVIESRADEYTRPAPTEMSPEQKLLLAQQWGPKAADALDAANRLAKSGSPDDSTDSLGVASIVLQQSQPAPDDKKKEDNAATDPAVQAILQAITQAPPQN